MQAGREPQRRSFVAPRHGFLLFGQQSVQLFLMARVKEAGELSQLGIDVAEQGADFLGRGQLRRRRCFQGDRFTAARVAHDDFQPQGVGRVHLQFDLHRHAHRQRRIQIADHNALEQTIVLEQRHDDAARLIGGVADAGEGAGQRCPNRCQRLLNALPATIEHLNLQWPRDQFGRTTVWPSWRS